MREKIFARACRHLLDRRRRGGAHSPIGLLAYADKEQAKKAEEAIRSIMTAWGFHDLVGQKVAKITIALDRVIAIYMKSGRGQRVETASTKRQSKIAFEGLGHPGASQASIDALFGD